MSLKELRLALDTKKISAPELTKMYLRRIKEIDKDLNSYITVCEESALLQAEQAQKLIDENIASFLTGIPISIKDNICTKGIKTTCASKMLEDFVPFYNATAVDKLLLENAVIIGKSNMDEFAMGSTNQTSYFGVVKNPHNPAFIPGGSSGGAAAGVAAGLCAAALGSDTGGSVRQPAAFCGVTGIKPTYGTISRYGLVAFASSLDQIGVIANSAEDTAYVMNVISGYDEKDSTSSPKCTTNFTSLLGSSLKGLKIGIAKEFFENITDDLKNALEKAMDFYTSNGAILVNTSLKTLDLSPDVYRIISSAEAMSNLGRYDGIKYGNRLSKNDYDKILTASRGDGFGKEVKKRITFGQFVLSADNYDDYYKKALCLRQQIKEDYHEIFKKCDVLLTPTTPSASYRFSDENAQMLHEHTADKCTVTASLAGLPAISTPCGYDSFGMPLGMSIIADAYREARIIAVADLFEKQFKRKEAPI